MDYLIEARHIHQEAIEPYLGPPVGAAEIEIASFENEIGFDLPGAYRQYLLWMGKDYHGAFAGSEFFLNPGNSRNIYIELIEELAGLDFDKYQLPKDVMLFYHHQACEAAWFELPKVAEDPLVYFFREGDGTVAPHAERFTHFLTEMLKYSALIMPKIHKKRI